MQQISIATKRTSYQGLPAYYPALVFQGDIVNGRTIKEVRMFGEHSGKKAGHYAE